MGESGNVVIYFRLVVHDGNLYFVKEVHMEGRKHLDHNIVVALCTDMDI